MEGALARWWWEEGRRVRWWRLLPSHPMPLPTPAGGLVLVGDLHGDAGALLGALQGLVTVDPAPRWTDRARDMTVVFAGDFLDRRRPGCRLVAARGPPLSGEAQHGVGEAPGGWEEAMLLDAINALARDGERCGTKVVKVAGNHDVWSALPEGPYEGYATPAALACARALPLFGPRTRRLRATDDLRVCGRDGVPWGSDGSREPPGRVHRVRRAGPQEVVLEDGRRLPNPPCQRWMLVAGGGLGRRLAAGTLCALAVVGDWVVCHGGPTPAVLREPDALRRANACVRGVLGGGRFRDPELDVFRPLWEDRRLSSARLPDDGYVRALRDRCRELWGLRDPKFAVGHTTQGGLAEGEVPGSDRPCGLAHGSPCGVNRAMGHVYRLDVGMSRAFLFPGGPPLQPPQRLLAAPGREPVVEVASEPLGT